MKDLVAMHGEPIFVTEYGNCPHRQLVGSPEHANCNFLVVFKNNIDTLEEHCAYKIKKLKEC